MDLALALGPPTTISFFLFKGRNEIFASPQGQICTMGRGKSQSKPFMPWVYLFVETIFMLGLKTQRILFPINYSIFYIS